MAPEGTGLTLLQVNASAIMFSSGWTRQAVSRANGGDVDFATVAGKTATLSFSGKSVAWMTTEGSGRGSASVSLNGGTAKTVSTTASATKSAEIVDVVKGTSGTNKLVIKVLGTSGWTSTPSWSCPDHPQLNVRTRVASGAAPAGRSPLLDGGGLIVAMGEPASRDGGRADRRRVALGATAGLALAVVMWGGYSHHWPWTGISGATATLWDWLHLLLLPLAFAVLPVWLRADTRVGARTKGRGATALAVFVVVVILGYTIPWGWTGFRGNTVWDWLRLVVLPLAVVLAARVPELRRRWGSHHTAAALAGLAAFVAIVVGGYVGHWSWTGFTGNTLWNWLNLLFLPLLVPTVVVPALTPRVIGEVVYLDAHGKPIKVEVVEEAVAEEQAEEIAAETQVPGAAASDEPPAVEERPVRAAGSGRPDGPAT